MLVFTIFEIFALNCVCFVFSVKLNDKFIMQRKKEFDSIKTKQNTSGHFYRPNLLKSRKTIKL